MSKLLENLRSVMRLRHYSYQTEKTYIYWIRQYIFFDKITHPGQKRARLRSRLFKRIWRLKKSVGFNSKSGARCAAVSLSGCFESKFAMVRRVFTR
jgi:hypothetical protein